MTKPDFNIKLSPKTYGLDPKTPSLILHGTWVEMFAACSIWFLRNAHDFGDAMVEFTGYSQMTVISLLLMDGLIWLFIAFPYFWMLDATPIRDGVKIKNALFRIFGIGLGALIQTSLVSAAYAFAAREFFEIATFADGGPLVNVARLFPGAVSFLVMTLIVYTLIRLGISRRLAEKIAQKLQTELANARLEALQREFRPHFLFNTLNGIAELIKTNSNAAERMLIQLSDLLRLSLEASVTDGISLEKELTKVDLYIELQQMRRDERFTFIKEIDPATRQAYVPGMILQPVIENAIDHGLTSNIKSATLTLRTKVQEDRLVLEVEDNGNGLPPNFQNGIGLSNTRGRLQTFYKNQHKLTFGVGKAGGTLVRMDLPFVRTERSTEAI